MRPKKLNRDPAHRRAMLRNLVTQVLEHEQVQTTEAKAKAARPLVDKMITLGKRGDLHARRQALSYLDDRRVVEKIFEVLAPRYEDRSGGYTRVLKAQNRRGDGTLMAIIELV